MICAGLLLVPDGDAVAAAKELPAPVVVTVFVSPSGDTVMVPVAMSLPALTWISQTYRCIGVENLRKMLCCNSFSEVQEFPDADRMYAEAV